MRHKFFTQDRIVIFDTEYTCWEGSQERKWSGSGEYREIIQIGAVLVETNGFTELDKFLVFVRPSLNPLLSAYCSRLTGITQEALDKNGVSLSEAVRHFAEWAGSYTLGAYGADSEVIRENCKLIGIEFPFGSERFFNLRETFRRYGIDDTKYYSSTIVEAFGKKPMRRGHDALNDARTLAEGLGYLQEQINRQGS